MARKKMSSPGQGQPAPKRLRRRRTRRRLLLAGVVLLVLLLGIFFAVPFAAGMYAPKALERGLNSSLQGSAEVGGTRFSWFGTQNIGPIVIKDDAGDEVARLELQMLRGLWGLGRAAMGFGKLDLGRAELKGGLTIVQYPDGSTNLERIFPQQRRGPKPPDAPTPKRTRIPPTLSGAFVVDSLDVRLVNQAKLQQQAPAAIVRLPNLAGQLAIADGSTVSANLASDLQYASSLSGPLAPGGGFNLVGSVAQLTDQDGFIVPEQAIVDAKLQAQDVAIVIADTLANMDNALASALGEQLQADIRASGSLQRAQARLRITTAGASADADVEIRDGVLTTTRPALVQASGPAVTTLTPGLAEGLQNAQQIQFEAFPDVRLTLADVRVAIPTASRPLDLRSASFNIALNTSEARGTVQVPGGDGSAQPQPFTIAPVHATLTAQDLGQQVNIKAQTTTTLGGRPAGRINIDVAAVDPLDSKGQPRAGIPGRLQGVVEVDSLATAIADPLVNQLGIDLANDVGPTLNLTIRASTSETPAQPEPGMPAPTLPPTDISLNIDSANMRARAQVSYDDKVLRAGQDAVQVQIQQAGPLIDRLLPAEQVAVSAAGPVTISASDVSVDLARMRADGATDLRAIAGVFTIETGPTAGSLAIAERPLQQWALEPISATINAARATRGVNVRARTAAMLDGQPAGTLNLDLTASELFTPQGQLAPTPLINGRAVLQRVATAIIQPWVEQMGLDLPAGIGPHVDLALTARSGGARAGAAAAGQPQRQTELDLTLRSPQFTGDALLTLVDGVLQTRGEGAQFLARRPGALLGPAARNAGLELAQGGQIRLAARNVRIPYSAEQPLNQAAADVQLETSGLALRPIPAPTQPGQAAPQPQAPISINQIVVSGLLAPNQAPQVQLQGAGGHQGADFSMQGQLALPGLFGDAPMRPLGRIELRNVPTTLAAMIPGVSGNGPLSPSQVLREVAGQSLTLTFSADRPQGAAEHARALDLQVQSPGLNGRAGARLTEAEFALQALDLRARISPGLAQRIFTTIGPELAQPPQIAGPAMLRVSGTPFTVPLSGGMRPDLERAGPATFRVGLEGTTTVTNLVVAAEEGPPRDIGPIGIRDLLMQAQVPVASLVPESSPAPARARLTGDLLGADGAPFVNLNGEAQMLIAGGAPRGDLKAELALNITDMQRVEEILDRRGMLADGLGPQVKITTTADVKFAPPAAPGQPPAQAQAPAQGQAPAQEQGAFTPQQTTIHAAIESANLQTAEPLHLELVPGRIVLGHPAQISWRMQPAWANWNLLQAGAVDPQQSELARFTQPADIRIALRRFVIARGENLGPLAPGVFELDADVTSAGAAMMVRGAPASFQGMQARLTGGREPGTLGFSLSVQDAGGGPAPGGKPAVDLRGAIYSIADGGGQVTADRALISAQGAALGVPTALVDAIAQQDGLLIEALGPVSNLQLQLQSLSMAEGKLASGNVDVVFTSDRAEARIAGTIHEATLITQGQTVATLREITPGLGERLFKGVPLIGRFEKQTSQAPATVTANNLTVPLDGNISHLNGDVVLDAGEATFATSNIFGQLLKMAGQRQAGTVGRRIEPFRATIRNGAASYERFRLPLGEFTVETAGSFDLVNRRVNVITYVPFGALTDEAAGALNTGIGRLFGGAIPTIERATMVPLRTRGSFDNPDTSPDLELFVQQTGETLLRPDRLIGGTVKDLGGTVKDLFDRLNPRRRDNSGGEGGQEQGGNPGGGGGGR